MLEKLIITHKKLGQTPLESIKEVKKSHPELAGTSMTYAGRLDPMAEGLMIVLIGDECKNKDKYLGLDKTYEFQILIGFETDTHDLLGLVTSSKEIFERSSDLLSGSRLAGQTTSNTSFVSVLKHFVGPFIQKYPNFSSKTINGKPLFQLSRDDESPNELPEHEVKIYHLELTNQKTISKEELQKEILRRISLVKGDFRQSEIINKWNETFKKSNISEYTIISCVCECSSGTYIRQLVANISVKLDIPLVTYSIKRIRVGQYTLNDIAKK